MGRIKKDYHELDELIARWNLSEADLRYVGENDRLKLSVRIYGACMIFGTYEVEDDWGAVPVPYKECWFDGIVDLTRSAVYQLFEVGEVRAADFFLPNGDFARFSNPDEYRAICRKNLVVREDERIKFEREELSELGHGEPSPRDFRRFFLGDDLWEFTEMQARSISFLYEAAKRGEPEQHCRKILEAACSASEKIGHLFSTRNDWQEIVLKAPGRRGWYYLEPRLVVAMSC